MGEDRTTSSDRRTQDLCMRHSGCVGYHESLLLGCYVVLVNSVFSRHGPFCALSFTYSCSVFCFVPLTFKPFLRAHASHFGIIEDWIMTTRSPAPRRLSYLVKYTPILLATHVLTRLFKIHVLLFAVVQAVLVVECHERFVCDCDVFDILFCTRRCSRAWTSRLAQPPYSSELGLRGDYNTTCHSRRVTVAAS